MAELSREEFLKAAIKAVVPTELSKEDIHAAKVMGKQYFDIIDRAKNTGTKITQIIYDIPALICFPIYSSDNMESLLKRYVECFPAEAEFMLEYVKITREGNMSGFSKNGNMKWETSIPTRFVQICKALDKDFWLSRKNLVKFMQLCPKLSAKKKHSQIIVN